MMNLCNMLYIDNIDYIYIYIYIYIYSDIYKYINI